LISGKNRKGGILLKIGILIIHGFAGNVGEIEPLMCYLRGKDYIVTSPILKGHTGKLNDLWSVTYKDWIDSAEEGLTELLKATEKVIVIGFSMGGLIAAHLAIKYKPLAIITLSTPIYHWDLRRVFINLRSDIKNKSSKNIKRYIRGFSIPLRALLNFKCLLIKTKPMFKQIKCPVFVAQGLLDDTVQHRSAEYIYSNVNDTSKEKKYYQNSRHLICLGDDKEELFRDIENFILKVI
jgi:carboxylesterase